MHDIFLDYSVRKIRQSEERIEACLDKLTAEQIWRRGSDAENAPGNLALHLCGNLRQWVCSAIGGAPDTRDRDAEFAARGPESAENLKRLLRAAVDDAAAVIERLTPERLLERVTVQAYDVPVLEAVYHVVEHFSYHAGQIFLLTKLHTQQDLGFYAHLRSGARAQTP